MRLLLTGNVPFWVVLLLVVAAAAFTIAIYRREQLRQPWSFLLPAMRICTLALLLLTLLEPVLSRVWNTDIRGHIPIVIDTSGSMSIADSYARAEEVKAAWHLQMFPQKLRLTVFEERAPLLVEVQQGLTEFIAGAEKTMFGVDGGGVVSGQSRKQIDREAKQLKSIRDKFTELLEDVTDGVKDSSYLALPENIADTRGRLNYDYYDDLEGWETKTLQEAPAFPDQPHASRLLRAFRIPPNRGDAYGARVRALIYPPETGNYIFTIAADDQAQLYLGDDATPQRKRVIAECPEWVKPEDYKKYDEQTSRPIPLTKDKPYYVEVLFKENTGDDHCSVGWIRPDGKMEFPVPAKHLRPFEIIPSLLGFSEEYKLFTQQAKSFEQAMHELLKQVDRLIDADDGAEQADAVTLIKSLSQQAVQSASPIGARLLKMQSLADETLAAMDEKKVQDALDRFRKMTRIDLVRHLLTNAAVDMKKLQKIGDVELLTLAAEHDALEPNPEKLNKLRAQLNSSRIASVLYDTSNRYGKDPISGIILLSDGNNNSGKTFGEVHQILRERNVPLYTIGIGSTTPPNDIAIERVFTPDTSFKGDTIMLHTVLRRYGYQDQSIKVTVRSGDTVLQETTVAPGTEPVITVPLMYEEDQEGLRHYVVEAELLPGEAVAENNRKSVTVSILADPVKALLVDQYPRWESRYANMMLKRDSRIEVDTIFIASRNDDNATEDMDGNGFPADAQALFAYDLLVIGDVDPAYFSPEQMRAVQEFVIEKGGTVLAMAGPHFMPEAYRNTPLRDVLPFDVRPSSRFTHDATRSSITEPVIIPLRLTEAGRFENPVQVGHSPEQSAMLWAQLPGMNWVRTGVLPDQHADVLVTTDGEQNDPVVITALVGLGKVIYLGSDSFWRWRYRTRWKYHHRFWGQILLWATLGRTSGSDPHVKLMTDRPEYSPGETIVLKARVLDLDKTPLEDGVVSAVIVNGEGRPVKNVRFSYLPNSGGEYRAVLKDLPKDTYTVKPSVTELQNTEIQADYVLEVRDLPTSEYIELALDEPALKAISTEYRHFLQAGDILDKVPKIEVTERHRKDIELWDSFLFMGLVACLLGAEWQLRKRQKLV